MYLVFVHLCGLYVYLQQFLPLRVGGVYNPSKLSMNTDSDFKDMTKKQRAHLFAKVQASSLT
jgi:hypothetical protein